MDEASITTRQKIYLFLHGSPYIQQEPNQMKIHHRKGNTQEMKDRQMIVDERINRKQ